MNDVYDTIFKSKNQNGLVVDFSVSHCQSDNPVEILPRGDGMFGSGGNDEFILTVKRTMIQNMNVVLAHSFI